MTDQANSPGHAWLEIIIPARNEEARLAAGLELLCAKAAELPAGVEIVVVDSASSDRTAAIALAWPPGPVPVRLIHCGKPGKGAAVRAGLLASRARFVGFCDADMATDLSALDVAIQDLLAGHQVVIGSRAHPDSIVEDRHSIVRKAGAAVFRGMARLVAPGARDTQCGFKFFAGPVARRAAMDLGTAGFAFDIELIARCRQLGAGIAEIPVRWRDIPGSTFSVWRHSLTAFAEVAGIWLALRSQSTWSEGAVAAAGPGGEPLGAGLPAGPGLPAGAVTPAAIVHASPP